MVPSKPQMGLANEILVISVQQDLRRGLDMTSQGSLALEVPCGTPWIKGIYLACPCLATVANPSSSKASATFLSELYITVAKVRSAGGCPSGAQVRLYSGLTSTFFPMMSFRSISLASTAYGSGSLPDRGQRKLDREILRSVLLLESKITCDAALSSLVCLDGHSNERCAATARTEGTRGGRGSHQGVSGNDLGHLARELS